MYNLPVPSKNPEVLARAQKNWRKKNPDYLRKWRMMNPEKTEQYNEDQYERRKAQYRAYYRRNRERMLAQGKAYKKANPEKVYEKEIRRKFGISFEEKRKMFIEQEGKCKICSRGLILQGSHIDHIPNSEPKIIRGLLCGSCNRALGLFQDKSAILVSAATYLRTFESL